MKEGGRLKLFAPSVYCFGSANISGLPKNSNLIFDVELLKVIKNEVDQLDADISIIDELLLEKSINAEINESGIRYVTLTEGSGNSPISTSLVTVKYKGIFLDGKVFDQNTLGVQFPLSNLIEAWKIMVPTMKEGGKIKIYAPSKFCYGTQGNSSIPPNTSLVFEIELVSFN